MLDFTSGATHLDHTWHVHTYTHMRMKQNIGRRDVDRIKAFEVWYGEQRENKMVGKVNKKEDLTRVKEIRTL